MRTRRSFVRLAGSASLATWGVLGNLFIARAADTGDAVALSTMTRIARLIFPHDALSDAVYTGIVGTLLEENEVVLREGLTDLSGFLELSESTQMQHLQAMEDSEFFEAVRVPLMWALYNTQELWDLIGYPGPSISFGGYINRGFNDIDWLPI